MATATKARSTAKKTTTRTRKAAAPAAPVIDPVTGMTEGSQSLTVAQALIEGGTSKHEIAEGLKKVLPKKSEYGNENPIDQKVYAVEKRLLEKGFTIESSYRLVPPAKGAKAATKKAPAKKSSTPRKSTASRKSTSTRKTAPAKKKVVARRSSSTRSTAAKKGRRKASA